jgi:hypothetical protein
VPFEEASTGGLTFCRTAWARQDSRVDSADCGVARLCGGAGMPEARKMLKDLY